MQNEHFYLHQYFWDFSLLSNQQALDIDLVVWREGHIDALDDHLAVLERDDLVHLGLLQSLAEVVPRSVLLEADVLCAEVVRDDEAGAGGLVAPATVREFLLLDVVLG